MQSYLPVFRSENLLLCCEKKSYFVRIYTANFSSLTLHWVFLNNCAPLNNMVSYDFLVEHIYNDVIYDNDGHLDFFLY